MANSLRRTHAQKSVQRIKTGMLIKRLSDHVRGDIEMTATQIRAAEILLRKSVPDLSPVGHDGKAVGSAPVVVMFGSPDQRPAIEGEVVD